MITEFFSYINSCLRTKISPEARAFGHLYESIALIKREKRCAQHWLPHRIMCKSFIEREALKISHKKSVLVLGSGPLHEIPITFLSQAFKQVDLVDIVHLPEVKKQCSLLKNVNFITHDITELENTLLNEKKPIEKVPSAFLNSNYDLVISANLLSQLAYHLRNFLEVKARPKLTDLELDQFALKVTKNHFLYLKKFKCPVVLITDIEIFLQNKEEKLIEKETPYIDFDLPVATEEWWWNVAPIPEYSKDLAVKMKVAGFVLNV